LKIILLRLVSEERKKYYRERSRKIRMTVILHYGGACECCGETRLEFLTIDHTKDGGRRHRREVLYPNAGSRLYYDWLIKDGYPKDIRVLCYNCNKARGFNGYSPHERDPLLRNNNMRNI
jgi:hypothetical protein